MLVGMADVLLTPGTRQRIDAVANEVERYIFEFFADLRGGIAPEDFDLVVEYARACILRALEIGALLHAVVDAQEAGGVAYPGRGREPFVKAGLAAWKDSFAPVVDVWRLCTVFEKVRGGEQRVMADVAALEVMAANRMFSSLDDQYSEFFASGS